MWWFSCGTLEHQQLSLLPDRMSSEIIFEKSIMLVVITEERMYGPQEIQRGSAGEPFRAARKPHLGHP